MVTIVIPSYNPKDDLIEIVKELKNNDFNNIICVNDGSKKETIKYFKLIEKEYNVKVLNHDINKGKGRALKTAFSYYLKNNKDNIGIITLDDDNQHKIKDVINIKDELMKKEYNLILGVRDFNKSNVPLRSKIGNKLTNAIFKLCRYDIKDTQTGLRGIDNKFLKILLNVDGEKFDFETNMILVTNENDINIKEVEIETIYKEKHTSNFKTYIDSVLIFKKMIKYILTSLTAVIYDYFVYLLLLYIFSKLNFYIGYTIIIATVISRILSSMLSYYMNRKIVFKDKESIKKSIFRYYSLVVLQMSISALFVWLGNYLFRFNPAIFKIVVDGILFVISYNIQKKYIFERKCK